MGFDDHLSQEEEAEAHWSEGSQPSEGAMVSLWRVRTRVGNNQPLLRKVEADKMNDSWEEKG